MTQGPFLPSNSTTRPRNGPRRRQKAPKSAQCAPAPRNQERAVSWATWLKNEFRGHLVHLQPPIIYGFQASESPNETRRPPYQWSLGAAGGPASPRTVGANRGSTRVPGAKKMIFSKIVPRPLRMLKQVFLGRFDTVAARFGPWKIPKCLENGPFWDQKWVKNESKTRFSKSDPGPFGVLKQVFLAPFEAVLTEFSPFHHMYAPLCALRTYLRAVWWSHLELGEGCRLEDIYIARSQRLGPDFTLAILDPGWWACQIQVLSQKLTGGGPGRWRQVGRCPPKSVQFWAKNSHFSPKTALVRAQNRQTKANGSYTSRAACLSSDQGTFGAL